MAGIQGLGDAPFPICHAWSGAARAGFDELATQLLGLAGGAFDGVVLAAHLLAGVFWVGGMAFAHFALRPSLDPLAPPERLALMARVLARFLRSVALAILVLLATGYWLFFLRHGGFGGAGWHIHVMQAVGWTMTALFLYLRFVPFARFAGRVEAGDWPGAGAALGAVRRVVEINLALGTAMIAIVAFGRLA